MYDFTEIKIPVNSWMFPSSNDGNGKGFLDHSDIHILSTVSGRADIGILFRWVFSSEIRTQNDAGHKAQWDTIPESD